MTSTSPFPELPLDSASLSEIQTRGIDIPGYDRAVLVPRIVHLGVGGFHRAHLALYCDQLAAQGSDWGICGVGMLVSDSTMADVMSDQDQLYCLTEKGSGEPTTQIIGSIVDYRHVADDHDGFVALVARPQTAIVSMTITEAGYTEPAVGSNTTFDWLVDGLEARRSNGLPPVTILSCDNLPGNGDVARDATMRAARRHSDQLADWVERVCTFPNSMVDRITPVTADADRDHLRDTYGLVDRWPVVAEPFIQWVVEDSFAAGRPAFEEVGVLVSDEVHAWELYKLRMLNAGHSTLAYLAALAGIVFVDEVMADRVMSEYVTRFLLDEAAPTLTEIEGHPREDYAASLIGRFANTGVRDQTARLCIDGSAKFPIFLIPTIERQLELDGPITLSTLALAAWARYLVVTDPGELAADASMDQARHWAQEAESAPLRFLEFTEVFPPSLSANDRFRDEFERSYAALVGGDARATVAKALIDRPE